MKSIITIIILLTQILFSAESEKLLPYDNYKFDYSLKYPSILLPFKALDGEGNGAWFQSDEEGMVVVKVMGTNVTGKHSNMQQAFNDTISFLSENNDIEVTYKVQKKNWFVLSGYNHKNKTTFYYKKYFIKGSYEGHMNVMVGFDIWYPTKDKNKYEKIVNIVAKSFKLGKKPEWKSIREGTL